MRRITVALRPADRDRGGPPAGRLRPRVDQLAAHAAQPHDPRGQQARRQAGRRARRAVHAEQRARAALGRLRSRRQPTRALAAGTHRSRTTSSIFRSSGRSPSSTGRPARCHQQRPARPPPDGARSRSVAADGVDIAPLKLDDDLLPTTTIAVRLGRCRQEMGWIVGEISLEELWRMVDRIRVGSSGYALIVGDDGRLIAHGNPDEKRHIADDESNAASDRAEVRRAHPRRTPTRSVGRVLRRQRRADAGASRARDDRTRTWTVVVEQPTAEAFAATRRLERQLIDRHRPRAARHDRARLALGPIVHPAHLRADARHALDRRRQAGHARRAHRPRRDPRARRRVQLDGRPPRRAAGGHPQAGTPGDVRPHRRRPGPRPLAPDQEHRQQLQADREDVGRRRVPRDVPPHGRARAGDRQARARRPAEHRQADSARALPGRR